MEENEMTVAEETAPEVSTSESPMLIRRNAEPKGRTYPILHFVPVSERTAAEAAEAIEETSAEAPVEEAPVEEAVAEETPVEEAPVEEVVAEEAPAEEAPVEEVVAEEAPVEEVPAEEEAPVEVAPVEETVEEIPAEETAEAVETVEEAPAEEVVTEEAPAEEVELAEVLTEDPPVEEIFAETAAPLAESRIEQFEYTATAAFGAPTKSARVYLPAGYEKGNVYPVAVILHSLSGDEEEWLAQGAKELLDSLIAEGKLKKLIAVFPNGRTCMDFKNRAGFILSGKLIMTDNVRGFYKFPKELRCDLLPALMERYAACGEAGCHAVIGCSMGAVQALLCVRDCADLIGFAGAIAPVPEEGGTDAAAEGMQAEGAPRLFVAAGTEDSVAGPVVEALKEKLGERAEWSEEEGGHAFDVWTKELEKALLLAFPAAE